jgi:NADH dehydrogenase [ubiquinone] 1 alpha subcomplex assembly factor 1
VQIPLSRYLPTYNGKILPVDQQMNLRSIMGLGISTTLEGFEEAIKGPGDFRFEIQWIKAIQNSRSS